MLNSLLQISINGPELNSMEDFIKQTALRWLNERNRRKVSRQRSEGKLHQMCTESSGNAAAVAMRDASDAAPKLLKIHDRKCC